MRDMLKRFWHRTVWSWEGWAVSWRTESSLRQWVWVNAISVIFAFALDLTAAERALIVALGLLVLAAELMNSALESAIDYISEERHPLAKRAKDAASAAVAVTAIAGGAAWVIILIG